jgi:hypothetical protein
MEDDGGTTLPIDETSGAEYKPNARPDNDARGDQNFWQ